jgi:5-methylcytosine-specific restriction endonuclease McrA
MAVEKFEITRVTGAPVSESELIADLRKVADSAGTTKVTQRIYAELGRYDGRNLSRRFGTWNKALEAAGLDVSNEVDLPDERLFENILVLWQHYSRQPRRVELSQPPSVISQSPYRRRFRSWIEALETFVSWANASEATAPRSGTAVGSQSQPRTGRDPSLRLRFKVRQRDRICCHHCGASPAKQPRVELHVDHIIPWSKGGETVLENLQTLCSACNVGKSNEHAG